MSPAATLARALALNLRVCRTMGVKRLEDLQAFQRADAFKLEVYRLANASEMARSDERYRSQLFDAAASVGANIAEGWKRFSAAELCQFLRYARGSLEESLVWLNDGVARGYFDIATIGSALQLADQCGATIIALWRSLQPFVKKGR
jgi:four helix bundle protein